MLRAESFLVLNDAITLEADDSPYLVPRQNPSVPLGMTRDVAIYEQSTQVWVTMYLLK